MTKHRPHKTHSSPLNNNHELIVDHLCKQTPKHVIAKKVGVKFESLRRYIIDKEIMKEVFVKMARKLPKSIEERNEMYMTATEALNVARSYGIQVTRSTLLGWAKDEGFGFQPGGVNSTWYINREEFHTFLKGVTNKEGANG